VSATDYPRIFPRTLAEWRTWPRANHATGRGVEEALWAKSNKDRVRRLIAAIVRTVSE
jgi:hypothetical protein